jgi:hypothetical protein
MTTQTLHGLPVLAPVTAKALGFKSITNDIDPLDEKAILASIGKALSGTQSAWVAITDRRIQAARQQRDILN